MSEVTPEERAADLWTRPGTPTHKQIAAEIRAAQDRAYEEAARVADGYMTSPEEEAAYHAKYGPYARPDEGDAAVDWAAEEIAEKIRALKTGGAK